MIRLAVDPFQRQGDRVLLTPEQSHYLVRVMRRHVGDAVTVLLADGAYPAAVAGADVLVLTGPALAPARARVAVALAQSLLKGDHMAAVVDRATQAGVSVLQPVVATRSIVRRAPAERVARWRAVAKEAAEQCGRDTVPSVAEPVPLADWQAGAPVVALQPGAAPLPAVWEQLGQPQQVWLLVGPEGGLTSSELAGCHAEAGLGRRILRAENAGAFAVFWLLAAEWQANGEGPKSC